MNITVFGAGSIGAYVGGRLLAAGLPVKLIGRAAMHDRIRRHGLVLSGLHGVPIRIPSDAVPFHVSPDALAGSDLIIVAVKGAATAEAAARIARFAAVGTLVLSLQNGVENVGILRNALPSHAVLGGMVPFNVVQTTDGRLHRGTPGELMVEASPRWTPWFSAFEAAGLPLEARSDFREVQWGKLILNLNNAVNALSGLPLKVQLSRQPYRLVLAALVEEALGALDAACIEPANTGRVPPRQLPVLLRLADDDFLRVAGGMVGTSIEARSSMWQDLQAGRLTEVEDLNGAVVRLAHGHGRTAPANLDICGLVHAAERGGMRDFPGSAMAHACGLA